MLVRFLSGGAQRRCQGVGHEGVAVHEQGDLAVGQDGGAGHGSQLGDADARTLCAMLGVEADTDTGRSALGEIGNIMVSSYVGALATMTGFELDLRPPESTRDMLGAVVASVLAAHSDAHELALVLDSELEVAGEACTLSFMLLPTPAGVAELLHRIGLGD